MLVRLLELFVPPRVTYVDATDVVQALRDAAQRIRALRWWSVTAALPAPGEMVDVYWIDHETYTSHPDQARIVAYEGAAPVWVSAAGFRIRPATWRSLAARRYQVSGPVVRTLC